MSHWWQPSDDVCFHSQVSFQQTTTWVDVKFSCMIKILDEKQKATELFMKEQQEVAISEAEARLSQLQDYSRILQESQAQITAVHHLSDMELIKVDGAYFFLCIVSLNAAKFPNMWSSRPISALSFFNKTVNFITLNRNRWSLKFPISRTLPQM